MPHPIRFLVEDHSTAQRSLVVMRSTLTGQHLAYTRCSAGDVIDAMWRAGVHPSEIITYTMRGTSRARVGQYYPRICHEPPHSVADDVRCHFLEDLTR